MSGAGEFALDLRRFTRWPVSAPRPVQPYSAGRCGRDGCAFVTVGADNFKGGQVVSWRADGSPGPGAHFDNSTKRRRINLVALIARLRR